MNAIRDRETLSFTYNGITRIVEPHTVGISTTGKNVLSCYQIHGGHAKAGHEWDLVTVSKIMNLSKTGNYFVGTRPNYSRNDSRMVKIYAEL
jgi:hypothetical protein